MKKLLYLFVVTSIFLSSCSKNCPIPEAQEEWLFVHTAESAKILNTTTIVMPLVDDIFAFTDRPYRKSYHMTGQHYAELWIHQGENCFQDDPPNAVLTWVDGGESKEIEVVITHAVLDSTSITYTIWDDSGIIIEDIVHPSLFVDGANSSVEIGDTYAGGIVFLMPQITYSGGNWIFGKGLIAAPADQAHYVTWATAVSTCNNYTDGTYSDWFLPSKDELNKMYLNLHLQGLGGFANNAYWSSTEDAGSDAWGQLFNYGYQIINDKYSSFNVRAVRAF
ncbi:DUF1566 domain-containing protein [Flavobacteriales bacterium]|nr:DUF1566 domain-containing protein [Flavobacteriales bacterium]